MADRRIAELAEAIRSHVFHLLDDEIGFTGNDAGRIAAAVEQAFLAAMDEIYAD